MPIIQLSLQLRDGGATTHGVVWQDPEGDKLGGVSGAKEVLEKHCCRTRSCCCRLRIPTMFLNDGFLSKGEKYLTLHPLCLETLK